jgi:hypothetical protein
MSHQTHPPGSQHVLAVRKVIKEQRSCHVVSEGFGNAHANLILDEYADELANKGKSIVTRVLLTVTALLKTHKRHNSVLDLPLAIPASRFISGEEIGWTLRGYWHMPCPQLAGILWSLRRSAKLSCNQCATIFNEVRRDSRVRGGDD